MVLITKMIEVIDISIISNGFKSDLKFTIRFIGSI